MSMKLTNGVQSQNTVNVTQENHSSALTSTGGAAALSLADRLKNAYSGSPIHGGSVDPNDPQNAMPIVSPPQLTMAVVKKQHMQTVATYHYGEVVEGDLGDIQGYYGFDDKSPGNMKYGGTNEEGVSPGKDKAPGITPDGVFTPGDEGTSTMVIPTLASPYMPNLTPPDIITLQPQLDAEGNPIITVKHADSVDKPPPAGAALGKLTNSIPGSGPRSFQLNPAKTSKDNQAWALVVDIVADTFMGPKFGGGGPSVIAQVADAGDE